MAEYIVEVNQNNSIDLPMGVREKMALKPGDKMVITFDNTEEHLVLEASEKAPELETALGKTFKIKE